MKKLKRIVILILIVLLIPTTLNILKKSHNIKYTIANYKINEEFNVKDKKHQYEITITNKNYSYSYLLNEKLGKKKRIIKEIKTYKENDLICIVPIYKKNLENNNIYCNLDNKKVSTTYLSQINNKNFSNMLKKVKKYNVLTKTSSNQKKTYKRINVYQENIPSNNKYIIWNYKGIYVLGNQELRYQKILNYDLYDNIMSTVVDKYFVLFENKSVNGIENIYYYDLEKERLNKMKLKNKISKDSYINGTKDNLIYVTDKEEKKQYIINIKKKKVEEIGNETLKYQKYDDDKLTKLSKSDFFMTNHYFENEIIKDKTINKETLRKDSNYYYYLEKNKMYRTLKNNKENPVLLFEQSNIKEWKIVSGDIIMISDDSLYSYNDSTGLVKLITSNELNYNYKNICSVWKS